MSFCEHHTWRSPRESQGPPNPQVPQLTTPRLCGWHLVHSPKRGAAGGSSSRQEVCSGNLGRDLWAGENPQTSIAAPPSGNKRTV